MSKVRIVTSSGERSRVTSVGRIQFDTQGVSLEEISREDAEKLISVSQTLSILGEQKVQLKEVVKEEEVQVEENKVIDSYTKSQVDQMLKDNGQRLIGLVSQSLGLDQEFIYDKLGEPAVSEPCVLITQTEYDKLKSYVEVQTLETTEAESIEVKDPVEETTEQKTVDNSEELQAVEEQLDSLGIEDLRASLKEANIPEEKWGHLKGKEAKPEMIKLILEEAKKELDATTNISDSK